MLAVAAVVVTVVAGVAVGVVAARCGRMAAVWRAGLTAGTVSGALVYAFAVTMTLVTIPVLDGRADYWAQFATSQLPTMADFLVNDILDAAATYLIINVVLGAAGSAVGSAVLAARGRKPPRPGDGGRVSEVCV